MAEQIQDLINKRRYIKGRMTNVENTISPNAKKYELEMAIERLRELFDKLESVNMALETLDPGQTQEGLAIEAKYMVLVSGIKARLCQDKETVSIKPNLPKVNLPNFSGDYGDWLAFKDLYVSMVHSNTELSNVQKFYYLKSCLKGDAASLVSTLECTNDNYDKAWTALLQRGKFASVRKLRHLVSGEEYAAKFIRKRRRAADTTREIQHEVAVLALCHGCTRVVRLHEVYETRSEVAIVLELCAGGELQRLLDEEERLTEGAARRALRHVLEGLAHLHARRVAHLDLKPQNLLLSADGQELLICDFGISRAIQPGAHVREILGTRDYVAPEILSYEPLTLAADIWSVGVLAYVLVSGYSPFAGDTKQETYLNIAQCQLSFPKDLFRGVSEQAVQFIQETLVVDPKGRLTVDECLEHPWLKDVSDIPPAIVGAGFDTTEAASDEDNYINGHNGYNSNGHSVNGHNVNGHSDSNGHNGTNGHNVIGITVNGVSVNGNGHNGINEEEEKECTIARPASPAGDAVREERDKPLKHAHARDVSPPFPDAPSTPKVSRKCSVSGGVPSVLALCKKFQPDYEPAGGVGGVGGVGARDCACGRRPPPPPPRDRAVLC